MNSHVTTTAAAGTAIRRGATPGYGPSCEPGRARRTGSIRIFQSPTFFGTMAAIALVVPLLVTSSVFADGSHKSDSWHNGGACNSQYKVSQSDSGCLHGWWDNSPPASTGKGMGSTYGARNLCSDYGDIKAHVDLANTTDQHFHLNGGGKKRGSSGFWDVSGISCCINKSDLCYKKQVEPVQGQIKRWTGTNRNTELVRVKTHAQRFRYCQKHPADIYCRVDPEGDATVPTLCGPSGNQQECSDSNCRSAFDDNESASESCSLSAWAYTDGYCTFDATCEHGSMATTQIDFEILLIDVRTRMEVCEGSIGPYLVHEDDSCT